MKQNLDVSPLYASGRSLSNPPRAVSSFFAPADPLSVLKKLLIHLYCYGFLNAWAIILFFKAIKPLRAA